MFPPYYYFYSLLVFSLVLFINVFIERQDLLIGIHIKELDNNGISYAGADFIFFSSEGLIDEDFSIINYFNAFQMFIKINFRNID